MTPTQIVYTLTVGLLFVLGGAAHAVTFFWDDTSGDHLWTNEQNWTADSGYPSSAANDYAVYDDRHVGVCTVDTDVAVQRLYVTNTTGRFETEINNGVTLTARDYLIVSFNNYISDVLITGGGTLQLGRGTDEGRLYVGYRSTSSVYPYGRMTVSGAVVNAENLYQLSVAYNFASHASCTGYLDLAHATIRSGSATNMLKITSGSRTLGGLRVCEYGNNQGTLLLPSTLTNITVDGPLQLGSTYAAGGRYSKIDLGTDPQLERLAVKGNLTILHGDIEYRDGATSVTGFPANVDLVIGAPGAPVTFGLAAVSSGSPANSWRGFRRFESYLSLLTIGSPGGSNVGNPVGELDLTATNTIELVGSITASRVSITEARLGFTYRGQGKLKLPPSITNMVFSNLYLGAARGGSTAPDYSFIDLGTNSQLRSLIVSNTLQIGKGRFVYHDGSGTYTGLPGNVTVRIGMSATDRGQLVLGQFYGYPGPYSVLNGIGSFEAYLDQCTIGENVHTGYENWPCTGVLDLRECTNLVLDVDGAMNLGHSGGGVGYAYLANGQAVVGNLNVGATGREANQNVEGYFWLSNVVMTVSNAVALGDPLDAPSDGIVTNIIAGSSCGIDLQTDSLTITNGGRMVLKFVADPLLDEGYYWGLKVAGDAQSLLQAYTNVSPALLSWDTSGLSPSKLSRFGIHYDTTGDVTYVGLRPPPPHGTIIICQ